MGRGHSGDRAENEEVVVHQHHVRSGAVGFAGGQQVRHHILVLVRLGVAGDELDAGNPFRLIADNPYFAVWQVPGDGAEGVAELLVGVAGADKINDIKAHAALNRCSARTHISPNRWSHSSTYRVLPPGRGVISPKMPPSYMSTRANGAGNAADTFAAFSRITSPFSGGGSVESYGRF